MSNFTNAEAELRKAEFEQQRDNARVNRILAADARDVSADDKRFLALAIAEAARRGDVY